MVVVGVRGGAAPFGGTARYCSIPPERSPLPCQRCFTTFTFSQSRTVTCSPPLNTVVWSVVRERPNPPTLGRPPLARALDPGGIGPDPRACFHVRRCPHTFAIKAM